MWMISSSRVALPLLFNSSQPNCTLPSLSSNLVIQIIFWVKYLPNNSILMTQSKYICDLLHKTHMAEAHFISSPIVSNCKLSQHGADVFHDPTLYRSMVGLKSALLSIKFVNLWLHL